MYGTKRRTRCGAFTLVELLVVLGVVSMVVGLLVPSLLRVDATARQVLCVSNLRTVGLGNIAYSRDHHDVKPPISPSSDRVTPNVKYGGKPTGQGVLVSLGYYKFDALFCPSRSMAEDVQRDREMWNTAVSGCSYDYFHRMESVQPPGGMTYLCSALREQHALLADINCRKETVYKGKHCGPSHPELRKINVLVIGGRVHQVRNDLYFLEGARLLDELLWYDKLNKLGP